MTTNQPSYSRRDVIKRGAVTSGVLLVGSAAVAGVAAAKGRQTAYIRSVPGGNFVPEGTTLTVDRFVQSRNIRCEAGGDGQEEPPHTVEEYVVNNNAWRLYVRDPAGKPGAHLSPGDTVTVMKDIGECKANLLQKIQIA